MKLELGLTYTILKTDDTTITFKFIGNIDKQVYGEINNVVVPLVKIFAGGYLCYWEETNS